MALNPDDALDVLTPHLGSLRAFPIRAWDRWLALPDNLRMDCSKRTRASVVHDFMLKEAAKYADATNNVRWFKVDKLYGLVIDNALAIRLKKLDSKKVPSNILTKQVLYFRNQCYMEEIGAIHHLEIGYNLDSFEKVVSKVHLVYPSGFRSNYWAFELSDSKAVQVVQSIFINQEQADIRPTIIKPKPVATIIPLRKGGGSENGKNDDEN